ncbi:MAG TPA: malate dehydrogenase (quinone) [Kofleriaceae bacterium]|nr:malate dehydrogenase (quinone) [Kofleriaceae bacterium]
MATADAHIDVALIGGGIMSATLATLLRKLDPGLRMVAYERLDRVAAESSDAWNNAGTGHSGFCELNYTPETADGSVDCSKALKIAAQFQQSRALWRALVAAGELPAESTFLREVPHISFVTGDDVPYLRRRAETLRQSPLFRDLEYTEDRAQIAEWIPLVMDGRPPDVPVAATRVLRGTDVNFGALTRSLITWIDEVSGFAIELAREVRDIRRADGGWLIDIKNLTTGDDRTVHAKFVFIGAGGYSLKLLEKTDIPEARGYGCFPVTGQWLRCTNRDVIDRHHAKVYGKAEVGAPPMSVPHLDTRWIDGKRELLFGPYAGITTKFLKEGSWLDLLGSIGIHNIRPVLAAGWDNMNLTRYLVGQALLSEDDRVELLRRYCPEARAEDWELQIAGLRVQIIKSDGHGGGELKFGTEVVTSADGTVAALLGASPGASTAVSIMLEVIARCFPASWPAWQQRLAAMIPGLDPSGENAHLRSRL